MFLARVRQYCSSVRAAYLFGRGSRSFFSGNYSAAARLLEEASRLDSSNEIDPLYFSLLGRCYLKSERYREAVEQLSKSLDLFSRADTSPKNQYQRQELLRTRDALQQAVQKLKDARGTAPPEKRQDCRT